ncbi:RNA-guided endonuclease InsQ/TnpB family protein [Caldivirga maquilingensis]|uniref:Transposase, IS605 OrfB family n=1 Tax=Caldivirga maquilingensis (strain ATCC 700844 / DSM 13496 / JCM 10307 / IC-167) TaxID=397948 RepID=A8MD20_CALMQ|nr:IS200/IS605 family accessory protein TnpB-related protein [Caldivirga maquilingensis]ABW01676.1 transposase, IS605 OrfB family [Caldivirga maquilingensis IC-167]
MVRVARTVIVRSVRLPRGVFRVFIELEDVYRSIVEQLTMYAVANNIRSFTRLRALKYHEMRNLHPQLPSHYVYTACQDASARAKSFMRLRKLGLAGKNYPEVKSVSIWLDDHLWRPNGYTSIEVATHEGWVRVGIEPHRQYWRYINGGWRLASEARVRLDRRNRWLIIYFTFTKEVEEYKPKDFIPVDVNENNVTVLIDGAAYLLETNIEKLTLGYYYRRRSVQEKYDKVYGVESRVKRRVLRKLKERRKKDDIRWKIAHLIVKAAGERRYGIVLERLGRKPAGSMISRIKDKQLRHRIYQAAFRGIQRVIEEKAREYGVPVVYVNPSNTSKMCPVHKAPITYNDSRIGECSSGGELWHRDVTATWNLLIRARQGDGSSAPSPGGLPHIDGSPVPLGSTATHDPITLPKGLWARRNSLPPNETVGRNGGFN